MVRKLPFGVCLFIREGGLPMYSASSAFHNAVANGAHQIALLIFSDAVFTNDDINVSSGIEFNDYFNTEEDLAIGQALSNEISFSLFNDSGLLNDYGFGEFTATIGAQIGNETVSTPGICYVAGPTHTYSAFDGSTKLKMDGTAVASQPAKKIVSMLVYGKYLYCLLDNSAVVVYKESDGSLVTGVIVNAFMKTQMAKWAGKGIYYGAETAEGTKLLKIWEGTKLRTYEFVPLGVFIAERPNVPYVNEIHFTCYDRMQLFETDMPDNIQLGLSYPLTFSNLYKAICNKLEVPYESATFINSGAKLSARPDEFERATMRDVLKWIAEAACAVARFDRDGRLKLDWIHSTNAEIDENGYSEFSPYWYETTRISQLYNQASNGDYRYTAGSGTEPYLIQDNPLLKGVSN